MHVFSLQAYFGGKWSEGARYALAGVHGYWQVMAGGSVPLMLLALIHFCFQYFVGSLPQKYQLFHSFGTLQQLFYFDFNSQFVFEQPF